ncbi:Cytochrome P450 [Melia azedarach]|uniref:Cytochrome P450 n=1 Tax=Melia azedarach TaxID=155640 RepID=A0ACC1Y1G3_MELAZ|nr:Cytochrome P450 [Melia azedarach]
MLLAVSNNMVSRCVLGKKVEEENGNGKFGELTRTLLVQFTAFCFRDVFPYLGWLDVLTGLISLLKATARELDAMLDRVIEEHGIAWGKRTACLGQGSLRTILKQFSWSPPFSLALLPLSHSHKYTYTHV